MTGTRANLEDVGGRVAVLGCSVLLSRRRYPSGFTGTLGSAKNLSKGRSKMAISKKKRFEVLSRDNFTCGYCGRKAPDVELQVDHIWPVSKGGPDDDWNLGTACADCNLGKSDTEFSSCETIYLTDEQRDKLLAAMESWL